MGMFPEGIIGDFIFENKGTHNILKNTIKTK